MQLDQALPILRWLVRDTFRQARASGITWLMYGLSGLAILFCLSVSVEGVTTLRTPEGETDFQPRTTKLDPATAERHRIVQVGGKATLLFGAVSVPPFRDGDAFVRFVQVVLAKWVAGTAGLLLALIWTAGFLPSFLDPSAATVLLAKPVPRWLLLVGKVAGVTLFVAYHTGLFFVGTWLMLGLRTGSMSPNYLLCYPLLLLHFLLIYSASAMIAVSSRSTVACVFGAVLFWLLCYGMNYGRHALTALPFMDPAAPELPASATWLVEIGYWMLPKPADVVIFTEDLLKAHEHFTPMAEFVIVKQHDALNPALSILTSLAFAVVSIVLAARQLDQTDY